MKTKTAILAASIITCATGHPTQDTYAEKERSTEIPKVYAAASHTSRLLFLRPANEAFFYDGSNVWKDTTLGEAEIDSSGKNNDSLLAVLSPLLSDDEVASAPTQTNASEEVSVFVNFTGNKILDWIPKPQNMNKASRKKGGAQRVVFDLESAVNEAIKLPEYKDLIPPQPAWNEWAIPCVFLPKWVDFWMTETNATPVILMLSRF